MTMLSSSDSVDKVDAPSGLGTLSNRIEAVQHSHSAFEVGCSSTGDVVHRNGQVNLIVVEHLEVPPVTTFLFGLHGVDDVAVRLGLTES